MVANRVQNVAPGLVGEVRRSVAGTRTHIDHRHDELEFDLVVRGSGSLTVGERNYALKPGIPMWLLPEQRHRLVRAPGLEMWVVSLRPEVIDARQIGQIAARPLRLLPGHELVELDRLLSQVAQDSDEPAVYNAGVTYVAQRALRASLKSQVARARPMHPAVARALLALRESGASLSLSDLATAAGVAAPYLSRLLIEHTGRSFVDWRNRIRLDRFLKAYHPGANLLTMALDAGFGSYARFHHVFNETIGCAPSEWVKQASPQAMPDAGQPGGPDGYGMPTAATLGARQGWTALLPLVAPAVGVLLGKDFLRRLVAAPAADTGASASDVAPLDAGLSSAARDRLIASLRSRDPAGADDLARLIATHDVTDTYVRILGEFDLLPARLFDRVAAFTIVIAVVANRSSDPAIADVQAVLRQVEVVLGRAPSRLTPQAVQDAHTALMCHFVVAYRALEAARASGDPRELDQLSDAARSCAREAFGGDAAQVELTNRGFVRRQRRHESRQAEVKKQGRNPAGTRVKHTGTTSA